MIASLEDPPAAADGPAHCRHPWPLESGQVRILYGATFGELMWFEMRPVHGRPIYPYDRAPSAGLEPA